MRRPVSANRLLAGLPRKDHERILARCERLELSVGEILCEPGERIHHVYFPITSFISLLVPVDDRPNLEVELVGAEGMFGVPVVLEVDISTLQAVVQGSGAALRLGAASFRRELEQSAALRRTMNKYIYVLRAQLARTAACNSFHLLEARLARWLLMGHDRAHSNDFHITHEFLGKMLGVRRVGITNAAGVLQKRKLMSYSRGNITILDRKGLERASCTCYRAAEDTYERIFGAAV
jgi:CRP-like cAMP-binding protein